MRITATLLPMSGATAIDIGARTSRFSRAFLEAWITKPEVLTASATMSGLFSTVICNNTGATTYFLPLANVAGSGISPVLFVKHSGNDAASITISRSGSDRIQTLVAGGQISFTLSQFQGAILFSDGSNLWHRVA